MRDQLLVRGLGEGSEAEQAGVVAEAREEIRLAQGLVGRAADAADADERVSAARVGAIHFVTRERQHRLEQADARIANRELGRVHAHRQAAGASRRIVAGQRALAPFIQASAGVERQRMRGNGDTVCDAIGNCRWPHA